MLLLFAFILGNVAGAACAQSINATGVVVAGGAAISTGPGTTTVTASTPSVVIDWSPDDTGIGGDAINFQSAGTSALFVNHAEAPLTVLNRIVSKGFARPIGFNQTVTAQLVDLAKGAARRGGTLYFYGPGGILVSAKGALNVGNLVLSASNLTFDGRALRSKIDNSYRFLGRTPDIVSENKPSAPIKSEPRAANVALILPGVGSVGMVEVDGSAVIVTADASTITFRPDGLFDIQIDQPDSPTGDTAPKAAPQPAYLVAMPRNDAITMAIAGGQTADSTPLGFDVARAAALDGTAVVLSAVPSAQAGFVGPGVPGRAIRAPVQVSGPAGAEDWLVVPGSADPPAATADGGFVSVAGIGSAVDLSDDPVIESRDDRTVDGDIPVQIDPDDARGQFSGGVSAASTPSNGAVNATAAEVPDIESAKPAKAFPKRRKSQGGD